MKSNSEARLSTVFLYSFTSVFTILQPLGSGYHEIKVNELPDWDWAWSDRTKAANWGLRKGYLCECFFFLAVMNPTFKHAPWKESMIKRSVDDLKLFDDQRWKSARIIWFLSSPRSGFRQLSTACKSDDLSSKWRGILQFRNLRNCSLPLQLTCTTMRVAW